MRAATWFLLLLFLTLLPPGAAAGPSAAPVIGGSDAPLGKWPDVAAVYVSDNSQECTGTLIAPTVVITAGHCVDPRFPFKNVLLGTNSLVKKADGEVIDVASFVEYPDSQNTRDIAVLILARDSRLVPRAIATGWASLEIMNGAPVSIVGYGAVDRSGPVLYGVDNEQYVNELQEAATTITDADCSINKNNGCVTAVPGVGELGAGGMGVDTCPGDSGGPLYLPTEFGTFLAGVTSRSYDDARYWCSEGGIYVRPDAVADWIEEVTGVAVARGPEPTIPNLLTAVRGHAADVTIDANDPKSTKHTYAITAQPKYAKAAVRDDGRLRVCMDPGVVAKDSLGLSITDKADPTRTLAYTIPIEIMDGEPADSCDLTDFDSGGCCDSGRSAGGSLWLGIGVLGLLVAGRRRPRRRAPTS
ncbi:MAG: trypsin-like serine protease [Myxococcales bacterium]|nr:trypsin-like serine protease [Myxococcales bacterium]